MGESVAKDRAMMDVLSPKQRTDYRACLFVTVMTALLSTSHASTVHDPGWNGNNRTKKWFTELDKKFELYEPSCAFFNLSIYLDPKDKIHKALVDLIAKQRKAVL